MNKTVMKMNKLPELVIWLISEHLNYEDVRNVRLTCKRLKEAMDQRRFDSLHLFVGEFPFERDLFETNELVNYSNTLRIDSLGILSSAKFKSQFSGLTKLTLYFELDGGPDHPEWVNLNDLNSFVHLLHLEVLGLVLENGKLCLPNLKIARFQNKIFGLPDFELHCPQLNALGLAKSTLPKLTPETRRSIRHLSMYVSCVRVTEHPYRAYELGLYGQLTNLSTVSFLDCEHAERFVRDLVDRKVSMPSLKRVQVKNAYIYTEQNLESFILFKSCKETKHIEFQINWKVIDLDDLIEMRNLILRIDPDPRPPLKSQIDVFRYTSYNMRHLAENPILHCLFRDEIRLCFIDNKDAPFLRQLIDKSSGYLQEVTIWKGFVLDADLFECLLKKERRIRRLTIQFNRLTQQQLDRMSVYLTNLRHLTLDQDTGSTEPRGINFGFVTKFNLSGLNVCFSIRKRTMRLVLKRFKYEPNFRLDVARPDNQYIFFFTPTNENSRFKIIRSPSSNYGPRSRVKHEFISLEHAIDFYYKKNLFHRKSRN